MLPCSRPNFRMADNPRSKPAAALRWLSHFSFSEQVLRGTSGVQVLTTSREPLRAAGEVVRRLPPLEIPPLLDTLTASQALKYSAVALFVECAAARIDGFALTDDDALLVADICHRLDGNALGIELAAGRVDAFGVSEVAARLGDRFQLLTCGRRSALPRHQTLIATLELTGADHLTLPTVVIFGQCAHQGQEILGDPVPAGP